MISQFSLLFLHIGIGFNGRLFHSGFKVFIQLQSFHIFLLQAFLFSVLKKNVHVNIIRK